MNVFDGVGSTIRTLRLGQKFSKMKVVGLVLLTITVLGFGILVATKSCSVPNPPPGKNEKND